MRYRVVTFEDFWNAYPRRRAKLDAVKAWQKLAPDEDTIQLMLEAIDEQHRCKQWREGVIPYPATWLRRGGWLDELGPQDFYQARL